MSTAITALISEEEYLHNPEFEHCEYVDGQAVPINVGTKKRSKTQVKLAQYLGVYLDEHPIGYAVAELHCLIVSNGKRQFRLPDICVVLGDESPDSRFLERAPDFVVEIKSPDDSVAFCTRKMELYLSVGSRLGWLVLPEERAVLVFAPGQPTRTVMAGESLDGGELLPDLAILVDKLF